jgi:hypothetical protein
MYELYQPTEKSVKNTAKVGVHGIRLRVSAEARTSRADEEWERPTVESEIPGLSLASQDSQERDARGAKLLTQNNKALAKAERD